MNTPQLETLGCFLVLIIATFLQKLFGFEPRFVIKVTFLLLSVVRAPPSVTHCLIIWATVLLLTWLQFRRESRKERKNKSYQHLLKDKKKLVCWASRVKTHKQRAAVCHYNVTLREERLVVEGLLHDTNANVVVT